MKTIICSVFDSATAAYMRPFQAQTIGQASRMFEDILKDPDHDITRHPEDYALFKMADFDDRTGEITQEQPTCIARAHEIISVAKANQEQK